jgi:hypothetical protein
MRHEAERLREEYRCLEAGDQPLVAVGRWIGKGVDRLGVPDDAADVVERRLRQIGVKIAGKGRALAFPQ